MRVGACSAKIAIIGNPSTMKAFGVSKLAVQWVGATEQALNSLLLSIRINERRSRYVFIHSCVRGTGFPGGEEGFGQGEVPPSHEAVA